MIKQIQVFEINQPIGTFYLGKMPAKDLLKITKVNRRIESEFGIQRDLSIQRTREIASYCEDPDATFPTPIILSITSSKTEQIIPGDILSFQYNDEDAFGEILDGQHRVSGIKENGVINMDLIVILMFDLTQEQKAYVFSTINSNQMKVDKSLIYDLFELSETRSPYKTCHDLARILNSSPDSPFYNRLKMLGKKTKDNESLSQGTFVTYLLQLISRKPNDDVIKLKKHWRLNDDPYLPLRSFFINGNDEIILKILLNYFRSVSDVFKEEWEDPTKYILSKTTGFGALIKAFKDFYAEGLERKSLTYEFFYNQFIQSKNTLEKNGLQLTSECFPSNEQQQILLKEYLVKHLKV